MKLAIAAFTRSGSRYAAKIARALEEQGYDCRVCAKGRQAQEWGIPVMEESLHDWTAEAFRDCEGLIFIGAAGIAVRAIAPFAVSKTSDPAVLCMDEQGRFVISLLSGHLGGANELTRKVAVLCGAVPVITTATDVGGRFSVDDFARRNNLYLDSLKLAKETAAQVLEERTVGFCSDFEICGQIPPELSREKKDGLGISISLDDSSSPFPETLHLVPRITVLGIGCRRGTKAEQIEEAVGTVLERNRISWHSLSMVASVDLKKEEPGLLAFCREKGLPFVTYSAAELLETEHETQLSGSEFVKQVTGVDNVCERSALKASGSRRLLQGKTIFHGVTVAAALQEFRVNFE